MQIWLPPSQGKADVRHGRPLDLDALAFPELTPTRERVLDALAAASASPEALEILGVGLGRADDVRTNLALRDAPAAPASTLYNGVLFDALDYATLSEGARRRARRDVLVFSGAFGVVRWADRLPPYRLDGAVSLPGIGPVARVWRAAIGPVLRPDELVIDARSGTYAAFAAHPLAVPVRVFREVNGRRSVVSHMAKHSRGLVARALLEAPRAPRTPEQAAQAASVWFAKHAVTTAAGAPVRVRVELTNASLDIVTD